MLALSEQQEMVRSAVRQAGFGNRRARRAAIEFSAAAMTEWGRIEPALSGSAGGRRD